MILQYLPRIRCICQFDFFPSRFLGLFCLLLACRNLLLTIWEASDPMRRVHWNILELEDWQLWKNVNCWEQRERFEWTFLLSKEFRVYRLSCRILKGEAAPALLEKFEKGSRHCRQKELERSVCSLHGPNNSWWGSGRRVNSAGHPACVAVASMVMGFCFKDVTLALRCQIHSYR